MKRFAAFLAFLIVTVAPASAGLYEAKNVAALIASTPQIKPAVPAVPNSNGFKSLDVKGANVGGLRLKLTFENAGVIFSLVSTIAKVSLPQEKQCD